MYVTILFFFQYAIAFKKYIFMSAVSFYKKPPKMSIACFAFFLLFTLLSHFSMTASSYLLVAAEAPAVDDVAAAVFW